MTVSEIGAIVWWPNLACLRMSWWWVDDNYWSECMPYSRWVVTTFRANRGTRLSWVYLLTQLGVSCWPILSIPSITATLAHGFITRNDPKLWFAPLRLAYHPNDMFDELAALQISWDEWKSPTKIQIHLFSEVKTSILWEGYWIKVHFPSKSPCDGKMPAMFGAVPVCQKRHCLGWFTDSPLQECII